MNVSNCTTTTSTPPSPALTGFKQQMQDFKGLASALQSGDLASAQSAFATLQNDLTARQSNGKTSPLQDQNTAAGKDFKALQDALKSGDIKGAQGAFDTLKQDIRAAHHHGHHHRPVDNDGGNDNGSTSATSTSAASPAVSGLLNAVA